MMQVTALHADVDVIYNRMNREIKSVDISNI